MHTQQRDTDKMERAREKNTAAAIAVVDAAVAAVVTIVKSRPSKKMCTPIFQFD